MAKQPAWLGAIRKRYLGPSATRTITGTRVLEISAGEIDEVVGQFATGAEMLAAAGFDAVELHFGHHYLVSAFLSPRWNKRTDDYGGEVAARARPGAQVRRRRVSHGHVCALQQVRPGHLLGHALRTGLPRAADRSVRPESL